jgi:hypothetical protein
LVDEITVVLATADLLVTSEEYARLPGEIVIASKPERTPPLVSAKIGSATVESVIVGVRKKRIAVTFNHPGKLSSRLFDKLGCHFLHPIAAAIASPLQIVGPEFDDGHFETVAARLKTGSTQLTSTQCTKIVVGVALGIRHLHSQRFSHGALTSDLILVNADVSTVQIVGYGVLGEELDDSGGSQGEIKKRQQQDIKAVVNLITVIAGYMPAPDGGRFVNPFHAQNFATAKELLDEMQNRGFQVFPDTEASEVQSFIENARK